MIRRNAKDDKPDFMPVKNLIGFGAKPSSSQLGPFPA